MRRKVGKFLLPRPGYPVDYRSDKEMYWHIGENDVSQAGPDEYECQAEYRLLWQIPEPWRMPPQFWNDGVRSVLFNWHGSVKTADSTRGHRYVKWVGPLYYMPPERSGLQRYGRDWSTTYA